MATHCSILAWRTPWTEEPGGATAPGVAKSQRELSDLTTTAWAQWLRIGQEFINMKH